MTKKKLLPAPPPEANLEAEQAVLGSILLRPEKMEEISDLLLAEDFSAGNRLIYQAFEDLWHTGRPLDLVTVSNALKNSDKLQEAGGTLYLAELSEKVGTAANAEYYARMVYDAATTRRLWEAGQAIVQGCTDKSVKTKDLLDQAEARVFSLSQTYLAGKIKGLREVLEETKERLAGMRARENGVSGVNTGFYDLNDLTYGWQPSDMIVLGGRPGHGKTALGLTFAYTAARHGAPAIFFSLEMSADQLAQRLISLAGGVSGDALRSGRLTSENWVTIEQTNQDLHELPLWIIDGHFTILEIKQMCRRIKAEAGGLGLVVIDYLQMIKPAHPARSRYEEVSAISRATKGLAKEFKIPVIVNAQLNRALEQRKNKRPIMSDLRDSGEIEQDADMVAFIYRDELYNDKSLKEKGLVEILVRKQRSGRTGFFKLGFQADTGQFRDHYDQEVY